MPGMFATRDMRSLAPAEGIPGTEAVHVFSEGGRLAYADRERCAGDTDFVPLPGRGIPALLDKRDLARRAALSGPMSTGRASPGHPPGLDVAWGADNAIEAHSARARWSTASS
jgi:gamma-glutamyltranspeptidase/glutathione hydrolase